MSRTYRRRRWRQLWGSDQPLKVWFACEKEVVWEDVEHIYYSCDYGWSTHFHYNVEYRANSKTGRKLIAIARSDAATHNHKEPGPHHFRNLYSDRPLRRQAKNELHKFMFNPEYEPMILAKPPLPYWT